MMRIFSGQTGALATLALLTACSAPEAVTVDHVWVRLSAVKANPAAAYFTLHGGPQPATLVNVTSDVAVKSEMHETMKADQNMTKMEPVETVQLPARATAAFEPGGRHVMLFNVNPGIKPGGRMTLTFTFADGHRLLANADVIGAGDPAPQ